MLGVESLIFAIAIGLVGWIAFELVRPPQGLLMPVMLGIPWLATVLGGLFGGLVSFPREVPHQADRGDCGRPWSRWSTLTGAFVVAMQSAVGLLSMTMPFDMSVVKLFVPEDYAVIFGIALAARVSWWVYWWNVKIVQLRLF